MIESVLGLVLLYTILTLVMWVDRDVFGTYWTPTVFLLLPFTGVVTVHFLFGEFLGFSPLTSEVIMAWTGGSLVFCATGHALRKTLHDGTARLRLVAAPTGHESKKNTVLWSSFGGLISIGLLAYAYVVLINLGGIKSIASPSFHEQWGVGWSAHVRTVLEVVFILVLGTTRRWSIPIVINLFLMMLVILLYQSKGALFVPLVAGAIVRVLTGAYVPKLRHFVSAVIGSFLLFQLVYLVGWATLDPSSLVKVEVYAFFFMHFMSYLFSGLLGFSESINQTVTWLNTDGAVLYAPIYNLVAVVFDFPTVNVADLAQDHYVQISDHTARSNVNTFFGTIYLAAGAAYGLIAVFAISFISHTMIVVWQGSKNQWLLIAYSYWGGLLVFGWFEYYFWLLRCIEVPMICFMFWLVEEYLVPQKNYESENTTTAKGAQTY